MSRSLPSLTFILSTLAASPAVASASTQWGDPTSFTLAADAGAVDPTVTLLVTAVELTPCDGSAPVTALARETISTDAGSTDAGGLVLPVGEWCGVVLDVSGPVEVTARARSGRAVSFSLDVDTIALSLDGELAVSEEPATEVATIELMEPGWFTAWAAHEGRRRAVSGGAATYAATLDRSLEDGSALLLTAK